MLTTASAAKTVCNLRGWTLSNLALQKVLYVSHMVYVGRIGLPLVGENFEAWDYGPVLPSLYRQVAMFGSDPVKDVFYFVVDAPPGIERDTIAEVSAYLAPMTPGQLVNLTHWPHGAWAQVYRPGVRHIPIPNTLVASEYRARNHQPA